MMASRPKQQPRKLKLKVSAARATDMAMKREHYMKVINTFSQNAAQVGAFHQKAYTLLTREWVKADWRGRENILRTVSWLLHLEVLI
jgi:hypothetical protein